MGARDTSREAYLEHITDGSAKTQRETIYETLVDSAVPLNRRQIEAVTGYRINAVCGRVHELLESKSVKVAYEDHDPITGRLTEFLEAVWGQGRLF